MRTILVIAILLLAVKPSFGEQYTDLHGDYLGQSPPGYTPSVFASGIVSTEFKEHWAPRFSPDGNEVFWWTIRVDEENNWVEIHKTMRRIGGRWTIPAKSPYDSAPIYSPDGTRLYFGSKEEGDDLSYVEKQGDRWGDAKPVGLVSRFPVVRFAYFPSITSNGTLYFMGYLEGQWANIGIYRSELIDGEYAKPELLPSSINTLGGMRNWTPFIAPDESYLIFCSTRGLPASDQGDLYISFRQIDGTWTEPANLGESVNSQGLDRFPAVSPDGRYLFFTQSTPDSDEDVFWVSAKIVERLRDASH
jgi:dipeptidyl aminopeptidase/acylaminoacyl peptidase